MSISFFGIQPRAPPPVLLATADALQAQLESHTPSVVMFSWSEVCGHCKKMHPLFVQVASEFPAVPAFIVEKPTIEELASRDVKAEYVTQVTANGYPRIALLRDGDAVGQWTILGMGDKAGTLAELRSLFKAAAGL